MPSGFRNEQNLQQRIKNFLLMYWSTNHLSMGCAPASPFFGRELRTWLSLVRPSLADNVLKAKRNHKHYHYQHEKFREFFPGDSVLVKDIRHNKWWSATVAERTSPLTYVLILRDGRVWNVDHIRRADAHLGPQPTFPLEASCTIT